VIKTEVDPLPGRSLRESSTKGSRVAMYLTSIECWINNRQERVDNSGLRESRYYGIGPFEILKGLIIKKLGTGREVEEVRR